MNVNALSLEAVNTLHDEAQKLSAHAEEMDVRFKHHSNQIHEISGMLKESIEGFRSLGRTFQEFRDGVAATPELELAA